MERVQSEIAVASDVVEKARVQQMLWGDVELQAQETIPGPLLAGVRASWLLLDDSKRVLDADRLGEPETPAHDGPRDHEPRIPVAQVRAFLNVDSWNRVRGRKTPAVVT